MTINEIMIRDMEAEERRAQNERDTERAIRDYARRMAKARCRRIARKVAEFLLQAAVAIALVGMVVLVIAL